MNFIAVFKWSTMLAVLAAAVCAPPRATGEEAVLSRPDGWTESPAPPSREGVRFLFLGRRTDHSGHVSTLLIWHAAQATNRKYVRDFFSGYLFSLATRDPRLLMQARLEKVIVAGRCAAYVKVLGRNLHPRKDDSHMYVFMTEAGIYNVQFTTEGEDQFDIEEFLRKSLTISAKEAEFAEEMVGSLVETLPQIKAEELKRLDQFNRQSAQPSITNQPPNFLPPAIEMATFAILETTVYRGTNAFEAKIVVNVRISSGESQTIPLTIQKSGQKMRMEARFTDFGTCPASVKSDLQRLSLERLVTILDLMTKRLQILLPDADAYLEVQAPSALASMMGSNRLYSVPLGTEDWQGNLCEKFSSTKPAEQTLPRKPRMPGTDSTWISFQLKSK